MLKGIKKWIPPKLLMYLSEMGHGDLIVIADANFPAYSLSKKIVECKDISCDKVLEEILRFIPLDNYIDENLIIMDNQKKVKEKIWNNFEKISSKHEHYKGLTKINRFDFYEKAKKAYCIISTGESRIYGNIIISKGVIKSE